MHYQVDENWLLLPEATRFVELAGVATDSRDRVFVFARGETPIMVFDREGRFQFSWGEGLLRGPTGSRSDRMMLSTSRTISTTRSGSSHLMGTSC